MVQGLVNARLEAIVNLSVMGPAGEDREIDAVVDTGFTDFLTLPHETVVELGLVFSGFLTAVLADGSPKELDVFEVTVMWDGRPRHVLALSSQGAPLVGMGLMAACCGMGRHNLYVEVVNGGRVVLQATE